MLQNGSGQVYLTKGGALSFHEFPILGRRLDTWLWADYRLTYQLIRLAAEVGPTRAATTLPELLTLATLNPSSQIVES